MFGIRNDALGEFVRYKVLLVSNRYFQVARVYFNEAFAPMAKFITNRCIFLLKSTMNWEIRQIDVKVAFLNGILEVEIN